MRKNNLYILIVFVFYLSSNISLASYNSYMNNFEQIKNKTDQCMSKTSNTLVANQCSIIEMKAWESEINKLLIDLKKVLNSKDYKLLIKSQNTWEKSKNRDFKLLSKIPNYHNATIYQNIQQGCKTDITKQRAINLYKYLKYFVENN